MCRPWRREALADRRRIEPCGLDQDVAGLLGDHGVEPAHDAGERDRLYGVGDDQVFRRKLALHSVQGLEGFAAERPPHQNLAALEQIEIEDVGGMTHLPQGVVGGVGGIVDGPLIDQRKPLRNRGRRWLDTYIAKDASRITRAPGLVSDFDTEIFGALRCRQTSMQSARSGRL